MGSNVFAFPMVRVAVRPRLDTHYADASTLGRHLMIIEYVAARHRAITPFELQDRFGFSRATAFRYLKGLREAGILDDHNRPVKTPATALVSAAEHC